jgi:hypothetical protein
LRRGLGGRIISLIAGVTQLVECNLAKVDVEGSNPFARSNEVRAGEPPQFPEGQKDGSGCVSRGPNPFARSGGLPHAGCVI